MRALADNSSINLLLLNSPIQLVGESKYLYQETSKVREKKLTFFIRVFVNIQKRVVIYALIKDKMVKMLP